METQLLPARCPFRAPSKSQTRDQPEARGWSVSRSRWQLWGDWPGTDCNILRVTGRHVGMRKKRAGWPQGSSILDAQQINLPEKIALCTPLLSLSSSSPAHTESRPNATLCIPSPFQASPRLPHRLIPCQSFSEPSPPAKWICCSEAGSSVGPPPPRLCSHHFISLQCPSPVLSSPVISLCKLPTLGAHLDTISF